MYLIALLFLVIGIAFYLALRAVNKMEATATVELVEETEGGVLLSIELPKENEKTPIAAEQMFASLHGLLHFTPETLEHISLEMVSTVEGIRFYAFTPRNFRNFVEGQIYAQYPDAEIKEVPDYTGRIPEGDQVAATELVLTKDYIFPIKTFRDFEVDPLAAITSALGKVGDQEQVWLQILIRPVADTWQARGHEYVKRIKEGLKPASLDPVELIKETFATIFEHLPYAMYVFINGPKPYEAPRPGSL